MKIKRCFLPVRFALILLISRDTVHRPKGNTVQQLKGKRTTLTPACLFLFVPWRVLSHFIATGSMVESARIFLIIWQKEIWKHKKWSCLFCHIQHAQRQAQMHIHTLLLSPLTFLSADTAQKGLCYYYPHLFSEWTHWRVEADWPYFMSVLRKTLDTTKHTCKTICTYRFVFNSTMLMCIV